MGNISQWVFTVGVLMLSSKRHGAHRTWERLLLPAHFLLGYAPSGLTSLRLSSSSACNCRLPARVGCVCVATFGG